MERKYVLRAPRQGKRDWTLVERGGEGQSSLLSLPRELPGEVYSDVLDAVREAYRRGREDRSAELIPAGRQLSVTRALVRRQSLEALRAWVGGWLPLTWVPASDRVDQYRIEVGGHDDDDGTIDVGIGTQFSFPLRRYRLRVLVEELTGR